MCDYSLEHYQSRPAVVGERYVTHRFPSGSVGFVAEGDIHTAVCMACDTRLELHALPANLRLGESAPVTFVRIEIGPYHDGVRFPDGKELSLQHLGPGVIADTLDTLTGLPPFGIGQAADREIALAPV